MPVESATYIDGLNASYPPATDLLTQADDHLRLIKSVLKTTFPNINAPVTATPANLNSATSDVVPIGVILAWYGTSGSIPAGWAICDGSTYTRTDGAGSIISPDLRDRVIVGAGTGVAAQGQAVGSTFPANNTYPAGAHSHTVSGGDHSHGGGVWSHALTEAELPPHSHYTVAKAQSGTTINGSLYIAEEGLGSYILKGHSATPIAGPTATTGSGAAHNHGLTIDSAAHSHSMSTVGDHQHAFNVNVIQPSFGLYHIIKI